MDPPAADSANGQEQEQEPTVRAVQQQSPDLPPPGPINATLTKVCIIGVVLALAGAGVVVGLFSDELFSGGSDDENVQGTLAPTIPRAPAPTPSPVAEIVINPDLVDVCNAQNIESSDGMADCETLCEPSDCCHFPITMGLSCLNGNYDICFDYHKYCVTLEAENEDPVLVGDFPPAPVDLEETCSRSNLALTSGLNNCYEACQPAACCYDEEVEPSCAQDPNCADYQICLALRAASFVDDAIRIEIEDKCAPELLERESGLVVCETACTQALCCIGVGGPCPGNDRRHCGLYQNCTILVDLGIFAATSDVATPTPDETTPFPSSAPTRMPIAGPITAPSVIVDEPVGVTFRPSVQPTVPQSLSELERVCANREFSILDEIRCIQLCSEGECCSTNTCTVADPDTFCAQFDVC